MEPGFYIDNRSPSCMWLIFYHDADGISDIEDYCIAIGMHEYTKYKFIKYSKKEFNEINKSYNLTRIA